jgi:tetratricopeptide (TPR) repeat protein
MRHRFFIAAFAFMLVALPASPSRGDEQDLAAIHQQTAALIGTPRTGETVYDKGRATRAAILRADFAGAEFAATEQLAASRVLGWRFAPFDGFMGALAAGSDVAFQKQLDHWISTDPDNAIALAIRGEYYLRTAKARRGTGFARELTAAQIAGFQENQDNARADIEKSIQLRDDIPYTHLLRLRIYATGGNTPDVATVFREGIARFPDYYPLYQTLLTTLAPKWGGTVITMAAFVNYYAGRAKDDSPLRLLYVVLYEQLLNAAAINCNVARGDAVRFKECVAQSQRAMSPPDLDAKIAATLTLQNQTNPVALAAELYPDLSNMVGTGGAELAASAFLELAADAVGSDNRQIRDDGVRGNYALDLVIANAWNDGKYFENAEIKYGHALADIAAMDFGNPEAHDGALARVYDGLAILANRRGEWGKAVAYVEAAIALGGDLPERNRFIACRAYYQLRLYEEGARACVQLPGGADDGWTLYWRGMNEVAAGRDAAALHSFADLAEFNSDLGVSAVIQMSVIQAHRKDLAAMLAVLNAHDYVYDERVRRKEDLAVVYNNRCYAYMELGELQNAQRDCNESLRFGSIPDAIAKQQRLGKLLKQKGLPPG